MKNFLASLTPRKVKVIVAIALAVASAFGVIQPEQATQWRNTIGMAVDLIPSENTGDLL
ncbi:hypothetical protein [uncultured Sphingomonas sp.]|uniref:hypothetical protein n=1 Tax=uncultured Sphingomonas sp. TaxID=158754 RepID=UPI0025DFC99D|nr:hypothetical protein [uncultured Sphingomonas sp.]